MQRLPERTAMDAQHDAAVVTGQTITASGACL